MELHQNSTNPPNEINLKIDSVIDMTLRKIIPWTTLAIMLNEMTPTIESSKQVIKILLHTLESISNKQQSMDIQYAEVPVLEEQGVETSSIENMIEYEQSQQHNPERNNESASKNIIFELSLTEQDKEMKNGNDSQDEDQSNKIPDPSSLTRHERIHTGEKSFQYNECGKRFSQKCTLKAHERIHIEENPFKCEVGGKSFRQTSHLNTHKMIHAGKKDYSCKVCNKRFRKSGDLKVHGRILGLLRVNS